MFSWTRAVRHQVTADELANTLTHGIGLACSILGFALLLVLAIVRGGAWQVLGCAIYGATLVCLYAASTFYHAVSSPRAKHALLIFDHSAIFLLIAGTYTPFTLGVLWGGWGWSLFGVVWGLAAIGIALKALAGVRFPLISTSLYVGMGWLGVVACAPLWHYLPSNGWIWLLSGGVAYTAGVAFFAADRFLYLHFVWHLFVLVGTSCHFVAVLNYAA